jgi:DNA-binding NarL/FixJ family response regulator
MSRLRIAIVDDPIVLAGIRTLLQGAADFELVGEASTGPEALRVIEHTLPDVAIIDVSLPGLNGMDLAKQLAASCPGVRLLALTVHEDRAYVQQMLQAGARGYMLKRSAAEDLTRAIRAVMEGGIYLDPAIAEKALLGDGAAEDGGSLSQREEYVLRLTARGLSNKEIAAQLVISTKTVETYKARAIEKLNLRTRADIVRFGAAHGWLREIEAT